MATPHDVLKDAELKRYAKPDDWQKLPKIYNYWASRYLQPKAREVFSHVDLVDFFVAAIDRTWPMGKAISLLSVGSGISILEMNVAERLRKVRPDSDICVDCLEMNPQRVAQARLTSIARGLTSIIAFHETDINSWSPSREYSFVMANHSLHHFVELERIFENIKSCLDDNRLFIINDMIGKNGHTRWPEALEFVQAIWHDMPRRYKFNHPFGRFDDEYDDWDYSKRSFEGVRAQDILPLLLDNFFPHRFIANCGVIDPFIERKYGHNFDPESAEDRLFIDQIAYLNERLIDVGVVKPTLMLGWFSKRPADSVCYRHWTAKFCLRQI